MSDNPVQIQAFHKCPVLVSCKTADSFAVIVVPFLSAAFMRTDDLTLPLADCILHEIEHGLSTDLMSAGHLSHSQLKGEDILNVAEETSSYYVSER